MINSKATVRLETDHEKKILKLKEPPRRQVFPESQYLVDELVEEAIAYLPPMST